MKSKRKDTEPMLTTNEAAEMLGITAARVRQIVLAGKMLAEKRGRDLFIPQSEVEKAKARQKTPGRPKKKAGK